MLPSTVTWYELAFAGLGLLAIVVNLYTALLATGDRLALEEDGDAVLAANWALTITWGLTVAQLGILTLAVGNLFLPQPTGGGRLLWGIFVRADVLFVQGLLAALALARLRFRYRTLHAIPPPPREDAT
jgi:hypothetical protein